MQVVDLQWAVVAAGAAGLLIGSFLNVVVYRLPRMLERQWQHDAAELRGEAIATTVRFDLIQPRSHCPACERILRLRDLIPVASWVALRGRCAVCRVPISARYPLVELATATLFALCVVRFGPTVAAASAMLLAAALIAAALIDIDTQLLPDAITLPLVWVGLAINLTGMWVPIEQAVVGAMAGYLSLWSIHHGFRMATGREGMGYGDFKLLAAIGAWLGWQPLPAVLVIACAAGASFAMIGALARLREPQAPIAFGPWLAAAGLITLFSHPALSDWLAGG